MQKKATLTQIKAVGEEGVIEATLNAFDFKDHALDITMKGAFKNSINTINERGYNLPMLTHHKHENIVGHWELLREDIDGLKAVGRLNLNTELGRETNELIKSGSLSGVSIGYKTVREVWDTKRKANILHELELLEASLVSVPCNDVSRISHIKTFLENGELPNKSELEKALKEAGLVNTQAKMVASKYNPEHKDVSEMTQCELKALQAQVETLIEPEQEQVDLSGFANLFGDK